MTAPRFELCQFKNETIPKQYGRAISSSLVCAEPRGVRRPRCEVSGYALGGL